ncbi:MAG: hypothetical protein JXR56_01510 [Candidatus Cloacimonetes bacterium]|nr:hypothetical protein [Candidatus Cloacimonadota bacterium]
MKILKSLLFFLLFCPFNNLLAFQSGLYQTPEYLITSGITILDRSPSGFLHTPAIPMSGFESGITYLYSRSELVISSSTAGHRFKNIGVGIGFISLNNDLISDSSLILNCSYNFPMIAIGCNLKYNFMDVENYDYTAGFSGDMGFSWKWKAIESAITVINLYPHKIEGIDLPLSTKVQFSYNTCDLLKLGVGIEMEENYPAELQFSTRLRITDMIFFLSGYQTDINALNFGIKLIFNQFNLTYAVHNHPDLKLTHACAIGYTW